MKLCKDCKYSCVASNTRNLICTEQHSTSYKDLVTGNWAYESCQSMRLGGWLAVRLFGGCGEEARHFKPKEKSE